MWQDRDSILHSSTKRGDALVLYHIIDILNKVGIVDS